MKYILFIIFTLDSICAAAQMERSVLRLDSLTQDSLNIINMPGNQISGIITGYTHTVPQYPSLNIESPSSLHFDVTLPSYTFTPGQTDLFQWAKGGIKAFGSISTYPGLMKIERGSIGMSQHFGNWSVYIGGIANKYGYFRGVHTQYGINGTISFQINPNLSLITFGAYYFGRPPVMQTGLPMPPSMIGYYNVSRFGGCFDYRISEKLGVKVGGQAVHQTGMDRYEFEPIATPYINAGSGKRRIKIELPVGQILYNTLKKK